MGESLEDITNRITTNALTVFIDAMCTELAQESGYTEDRVGKDRLEEAAGELADALMQRLSEEPADTDVFGAFIADVLEGRVALPGIPVHEPYVVDTACVMLNVIDALSKSNVSCARIIKLPMPEIIEESSLEESVSYRRIAQALGQDVSLLGRLAETPISNLVKMVSKGRLAAFACYIRDLPHGKCTFQVVVDLRSGKSLRATISATDVSAEPREWVLKRIDLADKRMDFVERGEVLSLETRIPFGEKSLKALQCFDPVDKEFQSIVKMSAMALSGEFVRTVLRESENGQWAWKAVLGGDSIGGNATALDCTTKFHGYKLEYRQVNDGAIEQIAARKGVGMFRFRNQLANGESSWRSKLRSSRKQSNAEAKAKSKQKPEPKKPEPMPIGMADVIVRSYYGRCAKAGHALLSMRGRVGIITRKGKLIETTFPITYCSTCKKYFMREDTYEKLRNQGIICCRIIEEPRSDQKGGSRGRYDEWNDESIIHQYGYNVNAKENLSEKQRHMILSMIVDHRIQTKHQVIDFIQMQVDQHIGRPNMGNAIAKWRKDIQFLEEYQVQKKSVDVRSVRTKR